MQSSLIWKTPCRRTTNRPHATAVDNLVTPDNHAIVRINALDTKWAASDLGFGAKLCIHPRQIQLVNRAVTPDADACSWAKRVLDASARAGGSAIALDGKMVDRPVVERAQRIIDAASNQKS